MIGIGVRQVKNSQWILVAVIATTVWASPVWALDEYHLDSRNTQVSFAVHHLGIQWATAHFSDISGNFVVDPAGPRSRVDVSVGLASLQCDDPHWNARLRSSEWLDVQHFPRMTYRSSSIERTDHRAVATGELTLHGMTRPIVLEVTFLKCTSPGGCQFTAHGRIKRSEYNLPHGFWTGGDQVDINISGALGD